MAWLCVCGGVALGRQTGGGVKGGALTGGRGLGGLFRKMEGSTLKSEEPVGGASETGATPTAAGTGWGGSRRSKVEPHGNFGGSKYLGRFLYIDMQVIFFSLGSYLQ